METKYEPIKFDSWQELAKYVIDGGEVYCNGIKITCDEAGFNFVLDGGVIDSCVIKKQPTLEELIAIKPRLCWVWDEEKDKPKEIALIKEVTESGRYESVGWLHWDSAQMLTDDEIKQFLDGE